MLSEIHDKQARHLFFQTAILSYKLTFNDLWLPINLKSSFSFNIKKIPKTSYFY